MDLQMAMNFITGLHPLIPLVLSGLGALVVMGQTYIMLSPSKKDDSWLASLEEKKLIGPLLKALGSFAPIQKKDKE